MKGFFIVSLGLVLLLSCCIGSNQPAVTTSTTQDTTTTTELAAPTTSTSTSSTTEATTTTTTTQPQCLGDEDCGPGGWCRQGICCGSYDNCGYKGECVRHNFLRDDGLRCWNGIWRTTTTTEASTTTIMITTTTIAIPKKADGEECFFDSECASGDCMAEVCCSRGQCGFDKKCFKSGQNRSDGRICQSDGSWKKLKGASCYGDEECITGSCIDGVCCDLGQCGSKLVMKCYNIGEFDLENAKVCFKDPEGDARWGKKPGQPCRVGGECSTSNCAGGFCCWKNYCGYQGACYSNGVKIDYGTCVNGTWTA